MGYRPGNKNTVADILSRRHDHYPTQEEPEEFNPFPEARMRPIEELELAGLEMELGDNGAEALEWAYLVAVTTDATIMEDIRTVTTSEDPKDENGRTWVPDKGELRRQLLELYHDTPLTRHLGIGGTYELVSWGYWWEGLHEYVKKYILNCPTCIRARKHNYKLHGVLRSLPVPEGPWQWTESDHIVKLPLSKGFDSIYVVVN